MSWRRAANVVAIATVIAAGAQADLSVCNVDLLLADGGG